jgi:hypothetical protein
VTSRKGEERIVFGEREGGDLDVLRVQVITDKGVIRSGIIYAHQWDHFARKPVLKDGLILPSGPWTDEEYRLLQYRLAQTAVSLDADVFVTDDPFLLEFRRPDFISINFLSSVDSLALIGSYLRRRDDYTILKSDMLIKRLERLS